MKYLGLLNEYSVPLWLALVALFAGLALGVVI